MIIYTAVVATLVLVLICVDVWLDVRHVMPGRKRMTLKALVDEGVALSEATAAFNASQGVIYTPAEKRRVAAEWVLDRAESCRVKTSAGEVAVMVEIAFAAARK